MVVDNSGGGKPTAARRKQSKRKVPGQVGIYERENGSYIWFLDGHWGPTVKDLNEAIAARAQAVADKARGAYVAPNQLTVADVLPRWLSVQRVRCDRGLIEESTFEFYERNIRNHIAPPDRLGDQKLWPMTTLDVNRFYQLLETEGRIEAAEQLSTRKHADSVYDIVWQLRNEGHTYQQIADIVREACPGEEDISRHSVARICARRRERDEATEKRHEDPGLSPTTVKHIHGILCAVLDWAVAEGLVGRNVARAAEPTKESKAAVREKEVWTADQTARFLEFAQQRDRLFAAYVFTAVSADRRGAVLGVHWEDLDLEELVVRLRWSVTLVRDRTEVKPWLKTGAGHEAPLTTVLFAILDRWRLVQEAERAAYGENIHVCRDVPATYAEATRPRRPKAHWPNCDLPGYHDRGLVFSRPNGDYLHPERFSTSLVRRVQQYNRLHPDEKPLPIIRPHALRHGWATLARRLEVAIPIIQDQLDHGRDGHKTTLLYARRSITPAWRDSVERIANLLLAPAIIDADSTLRPSTEESG